MHDDMINDVLHIVKRGREMEEAKEKKTSYKKKIIQKRKLANFTNSPVAHSTEWIVRTFTGHSSCFMASLFYLPHSQFFYEHEFRCRENGTRRKNFRHTHIECIQKKIHEKNAIQLNDNKNGINLNFWLNILAFYWNVAKQTIF